MKTIISTVSQLKELCTHEPIECAIMLGGGAIRSSKSIMFDTDTNKFSIVNYIDDTEDLLTEEELFDQSKTNVGLAINQGALIIE